MEQKYLIDSNIVIYYLSNQIPVNGTEFIKTLVDLHPNVSIITKIEVLGFQVDSDTHSILTAFINDSFVFELDSETVNATIALRKSYKIKLPDAIIASTALVNQMVLVTRNEGDFIMIDGIKVINPFSL